MNTFEKIFNTTLIYICKIVCIVGVVGLLSLLLVELYGLIVPKINEIFNANLFNPYLWLVEATGGFPNGSFYR